MDTILYCTHNTWTIINSQIYSSISSQEYNSFEKQFVLFFDKEGIPVDIWEKGDGKKAAFLRCETVTHSLSLALSLLLHTALFQQSPPTEPPYRDPYPLLILHPPYLFLRSFLLLLLLLATWISPLQMG